MKKKHLVDILSVTTAVSFLLCAVSFFCGGNRKRNGEKTAFLNPSYAKNAESILIFDSVDSIQLFKDGEIWRCEKETSDGNFSVLTFADSKKIVHFMELLTKIRTVYKISNSDSEKSDEYSKKVVVYDAHKKILCEICFGKTDALLSQISFFASDEKNRFETGDDFSAFLTSSVDFWSAPEIFFWIDSPSNLNLSQNEIYAFKSLRHGKIHPVSDFGTDFVPCGAVLVLGQFQDAQKISFFERKSFGGSDFFYTQEIFPLEKQDSALYEISGWTYRNIMSLLRQEQRTD